ncbi:unnamed protein product, partial [Meganyctiphanes norvegica]
CCYLYIQYNYEIFCRVYCEHCIEMLVNENAVETAKTSYMWRCFSCNSTNHGLFKKRNIANSNKKNSASQNEKPTMLWGEYLIEKVVSKRVQQGSTKTEYLIKWQGLSPEHNTWEPEEHMFGIQSLLREYKRHLNNAPSSYRNVHAEYSILDESTSSSNPPKDDISSLTSFSKRKRVCPQKVTGNGISAGNDIKTSLSHTELLLCGKQVATKETKSAEIKVNKTDYGTMVWAKIQGFPWWPAMIVKEHLCGFAKLKEDEACVFWFGDDRVSKIPLKDVKDFTTCCKESMFESSNESYMRAMAQALRICHDRCRDSDVYLYTYEEYVNWARRAFKKDPRIFRHISDLDPYPPKIYSLLKTILNYREAQKEEKWEEERWKLYDPRKLPKPMFSSVSSIFGRNLTASKSFSSCDPNTTENCVREIPEQCGKSSRLKHFKSKNSFLSSSTSLDSDNFKDPVALKQRNPKQKQKVNRRAMKCIENENSWEVEKIIKHRKRGKLIGQERKNFHEYLIKWRGYPSSQN